MARTPEAQDLFLSLAEQVKLPFVQISNAAELMGKQDIEASRKEISLISEAALKLIDGYLLSVNLQRVGRLELEPVSLSSVLYDTADSLHEYAQAHGCKLELSINGKYAPVMAHRRAVQAALASLGYSFIEAASGEANGKQSIIRLAVRRNHIGTNVGVFSEGSQLSGQLLARARQLQTTAHQPLPGFGSSNGSGVFIADTLFSQLNAPMRSSKQGGFHGLAATLLPSRQLSLV